MKRNIFLAVNSLVFFAGCAALLINHTLSAALALLALSINMLLFWGTTVVTPKHNPPGPVIREIQPAPDTDTPASAEPGRCPARTPDDGIYRILPPADVTPPVSVLPYLEHFLEEYGDILRRKQLQLSVRCEEEGLFVHLSPEILRLVFANMMDNSLKFLPACGMITITLSRIENDMLVIWKDNGPGLDCPNPQKLCGLNVQGPNKLGGTGLGLAQVSAAVHAGNGTVTVKSSAGNGFALYIRLPLSAA